MINKIQKYFTSFRFKRFLIQNKNINRTIEYLSAIRRLYKIILFLVLVIVLIFIIIAFKLLFGNLYFKDVIAPIMIALSALLGSIVAITNMRQNFFFEVNKTTKSDVSELRLLAATGYTIQNELLSLEGMLIKEAPTSKYYFQKFNSLAKRYEKQMYQKDIMGLIDNSTLHFSLVEVFFKLQLITDGNQHILDMWYKNKEIISQSFILGKNPEEDHAIQVIRAFKKENQQFLDRLDVITNERAKYYKRMLKREKN